MLKWRLMVTTFPWVVLVLGIKLALEFGLGWPGAVEFSEVGIVLTAGVFLMGFMLAGTLSDYKESEKLPGDVACTLETLEEVLVQGAASKGLDAAPYRRAVYEVGVSLRDWLLRKATQPQAFAALTAFHSSLITLELAGGGAYASRAVAELNTLRRTVTRIGVISRTGFLPPAYALLETLLGLILILVVAAKYKSALAMEILVPFITLIYVYMLQLIRDLDDPFDYAPAGSETKGSAEVELFPFEEYLERLSARASALPSLRTSAPGS